MKLLDTVAFTDFLGPVDSTCTTIPPRASRGGTDRLAPPSATLERIRHFCPSRRHSGANVTSLDWVGIPRQLQLATPPAVATEVEHLSITRYRLRSTRQRRSPVPPHDDRRVPRRSAPSKDYNDVLDLREATRLRVNDTPTPVM